MKQQALDAFVTTAVDIQREAEARDGVNVDGLSESLTKTGDLRTPPWAGSQVFDRRQNPYGALPGEMLDDDPVAQDSIAASPSKPPEINRYGEIPEWWEPNRSDRSATIDSSDGKDAASRSSDATNTNRPQKKRAEVKYPPDRPNQGPNTTGGPLAPNSVDWHPRHPGLGTVKGPHGRDLWIYEWHDGAKTVRKVLAPVDYLSAEEAMTKARGLRLRHIPRVRTGNPAPADPEVRQPTARLALDRAVTHVRPTADQVPARRAIPTTTPRRPAFSAFAMRFLRDCRSRWKPRTYEAHAGAVRRQLIPAFGERQVVEIRRADVCSWYDNPATGEPRALSVLSSIMIHAEDLGIRADGTNPCAGLRRRRSGFKAKYPTEADYARIGEALGAARTRSPVLFAMALFLAVTGARRGEALNLKWREINADRALLPDSKSGPKTIWLALVARKLLGDLPRTRRQPYVFDRMSRSQLDSQLSSFWNDIRRSAGLDGTRVHDLRHGFASIAVAEGLDLREVGLLLGHVDFATTLGYAHLDTTAVAAASMRVSRHLAEKLSYRPAPNAS